MASADQLPRSLRTKYAKVMKQHRRQLTRHFKQDGWDLDFLCLVSEIAQDLLGVDLASVIWADLIKADYIIKLDKKKMDLSLNKKRKKGAKCGKRKQ